MFHHKSLDPAQFNGGETEVSGAGHRIKPELSLTALAAHVNMHGLCAITRVEEEPIRPTLRMVGTPLSMAAFHGRSNS